MAVSSEKLALQCVCFFWKSGHLLGVLLWIPGPVWLWRVWGVLGKTVMWNLKWSVFIKCFNYTHPCVFAIVYCVWAAGFALQSFHQSCSCLCCVQHMLERCLEHPWKPRAVSSCHQQTPTLPLLLLIFFHSASGFLSLLPTLRNKPRKKIQDQFWERPNTMEVIAM